MSDFPTVDAAIIHPDKVCAPTTDIVRRKVDNILSETAVGFSVALQDFTMSRNTLIAVCLATLWRVVGGVPFCTESNVSAVNVDDLASKLTCVYGEDTITIVISRSTSTKCKLCSIYTVSGKKRPVAFLL